MVDELAQPVDNPVESVDKSVDEAVSPARSRRTLLWTAILALALVAAVLLVYALRRRPQPNRNALAIHERATIKSLDVPLQPLRDLDGLSRAEVLALRTEAVARTPQLIDGEYRPSDAVFGQIVDGLPWWGILGIHHYGSGERSIDGPSEQSQSILNPFLLAVPEIYAQWDREAVTEAEQPGATYPLYCGPHRLRWYPARAYADVTYSATCFRRNRVVYLSLIAYNARDLGLSHIYVSYRDSSGITKADPPGAPYDNPQYLHRGGSCGYPGGCNNISPRTPPIDNIQITNYPAKIVVWFWAGKPASADVPPELIYVIHIL